MDVSVCKNKNKNQTLYNRELITYNLFISHKSVMFKMRRIYGENTPRNRPTQTGAPANRNRNRAVVPETIFLFTNARDEPAILEWAFHHLLLGFSHVYIYDHLSKIPIQTILSDFAKQHPEYQSLTNRIIVIRINLDLSPTASPNKNQINPNPTKTKNIKIPLMNSALEYSIAQNADWMLYLDADEFICINTATFKEDNPIQQLLSLFYFADTLAINWLMFGSSKHETQPEGLLMDNFIHSDRKLNAHVKTFVRPRHVQQAFNPHYFPATNPNRAFAATGNTMEAMTAFNPVEMEFQNAPIYIAHYVVQSKAEFMRRKGRPMDDGTGNKSGMYAPDVLHVVHNEVENTQLRDRHAEAVREILASD